jgi:hypothetical protein
MERLRSIKEAKNDGKSFGQAYGNTARTTGSLVPKVAGNLGGFDNLLDKAREMKSGRNAARTTGSLVPKVAGNLGGFDNLLDRAKEIRSASTGRLNRSPF